MNIPNPDRPANVPEWAHDLEGFLNSGAVSGSGDGQITHYAVLKDGSAPLDGSVVKRLGNGVVALSDIFSKNPSSDETVPPSQAEVVLFLVEAEHQAKQQLTGVTPGTRAARHDRRFPISITSEQRRQKRLVNTQRRLAQLGFSPSVSLHHPQAP